MKLHCVVFKVLFLLSTILHAQYNIQNSVICNGAGLQEDDQQKLAVVVGQSIAGSQNDETFYVFAGFDYQSRRIITDVYELAGLIPQEFRLEQNYPNPFNPATTILFAVPKTCNVTIKIYDIRGREVAILINGFYQPGLFKAVFDARALPTGIYFYRLQADYFNAVRKAIVVK